MTLTCDVIVHGSFVEETLFAVWTFERFFLFMDDLYVLLQVALVV